MKKIFNTEVNIKNVGETLEFNDGFLKLEIYVD